VPILHWRCWQGAGRRVGLAPPCTVAEDLLNLPAAVPGRQLSLLKKQCHFTVLLIRCSPFQELYNK